MGKEHTTITTQPHIDRSHFVTSITNVACVCVFVRYGNALHDLDKRVYLIMCIASDTPPFLLHFVLSPRAVTD